MATLDNLETDGLLGSPVIPPGSAAAAFWATAQHQKPTQWQADSIYESATVLVFGDLSALAIVNGRVRGVAPEALAIALGHVDRLSPEDCELLAFLRNRLVTPAAA